MLYEALQKENLANEQDLDVDDLGTAGTNSRCQSQGIKVKTESNALASSIGETTNTKYIQGIGFNPFQERANQVVTYEWVSIDCKHGGSPPCILLALKLEQFLIQYLCTVTFVNNLGSFRSTSEMMLHEHYLCIRNNIFTSYMKSCMLVCLNVYGISHCAYQKLSLSICN